jgi:hypothetical protein
MRTNAEDLVPTKHADNTTQEFRKSHSQSDCPVRSARALARSASSWSRMSPAECLKPSPSLPSAAAAAYARRQQSHETPARRIFLPQNSVMAAAAAERHARQPRGSPKQRPKARAGGMQRRAARRHRGGRERGEDCAERGPVVVS